MTTKANKASPVSKRPLTGAEMLASGMDAVAVIAIMDKRAIAPGTKPTSKPQPLRAVVVAGIKGATQVVDADSGKRVWRCPLGCERNYGKLTSLAVYHLGLALPLEDYKAARSYPTQPELVKLAHSAKLLDVVPGLACLAYTQPSASPQPPKQAAKVVTA